jgi:hypothetical protein
MDEAFDLQGLDASIPQCQIRRQEEVIVVCDICGEEVENSEELAKHKERMHAMGGDKPEQESTEVPEESEVPEPAQRPGRM